jgi:hypothetical protein
MAMASPLTRHSHFASQITREAERRLAHLLDCTCRQAQSGTAPVTGNSRDPHYKGRSPFGAPQRIAETFISTRLGPALPGITGCKRQWAFRPPPLQCQCSQHLAVRTRAGRA